MHTRRTRNSDGPNQQLTLQLQFVLRVCQVQVDVSYGGLHVQLLAACCGHVQVVRLAWRMSLCGRGPFS
jgi:hypothetical protein